jgi:hypothetical protein
VLGLTTEAAEPVAGETLSSANGNGASEEAEPASVVEPVPDGEAGES